jgi:dTDP-4-amino-4,6-dideoxygalactose transaminase
MMKIPFNKPYLAGNELNYIQEAVAYGKISGDGIFTKKCHDFFNEKFGFKKSLLTTSCTDALEMAAILSGIEPGDEVIAPSYTFVSTVNPFILRGAKIVFADSHTFNPNIDESKIESLVSVKTKAIVVVHYAGIACNMDVIMNVAQRHNLIVIEDAAQAIDSYFNGKPLGSFGAISAFSFHETKNIISGEGGMAVINNENYFGRAEIIREKGTNRSKFFRGEIDKYGWVDIGSSFLPSDIIAAYLYGQLEKMDMIQSRRKKIWQTYETNLSFLSDYEVTLPVIPDFATNNAHMYYFVVPTLAKRTLLLEYLKNKGIYAVFHYQSLHSSDFYKNLHDGRLLPQADRYTSGLVRLPLFYEMDEKDQMYIIQALIDYFKK